MPQATQLSESIISKTLTVHAFLRLRFVLWRSALKCSSFETHILHVKGKEKQEGPNCEGVHILCVRMGRGGEGQEKGREREREREKERERERERQGKLWPRRKICFWPQTWESVQLGTFYQAPLSLRLKLERAYGSSFMSKQCCWELHKYTEEKIDPKALVYGWNILSLIEFHSVWPIFEPFKVNFMVSSTFSA